MNIAWIYLFVAGLCEIGWAIGLKYSNGFSKPVVSLFTVVIMILSFVLLAQAMKTLPVSSAYAIWTGIGAAGTAIIGMFFMGESKEAVKFFCLFLIIAGVVGLKLFAKE